MASSNGSSPDLNAKKANWKDTWDGTCKNGDACEHAKAGGPDYIALPIAKKTVLGISIKGVLTKGGELSRGTGKCGWCTDVANNLKLVGTQGVAASIAAHTASANPASIVSPNVPATEMPHSTPVIDSSALLETIANMLTNHTEQTVKQLGDLLHSDTFIKRLAVAMVEATSEMKAAASGAAQVVTLDTAPAVNVTPDAAPTKPETAASGAAQAVALDTTPVVTPEDAAKAAKKNAKKAAKALAAAQAAQAALAAAEAAQANP